MAAEAAVGVSPIPSIFGSSSGLLEYGVEINGPAGLLPVLIDGAGAASSAAPAGASFAVESHWDLLDFGSPLAGDDIRSGQLSGSFSRNFDRTVSLNLSANHIYNVFMLADAPAAATLEGSKATATAFIDPVFSFGPGLDSTSYSFLFRAGIGNALPPVAAAPEGGTLAPLIAGLRGAESSSRISPHPAGAITRRS